MEEIKMEKFEFKEIELTKEEKELMKELQGNLARGGASGGLICWCEK